MTHLTEEQFNLYLDNALSPAEQAAAETHLAVCEQCQTELASLQMVFTALEVLEPDTLPLDLTAVVVSDIKAERQRIIRRRRLGWLIPALQGIAALLLLFFDWSTLTTHYNKLVQAVPTDEMGTTWTDLLGQGYLLWATALARWQLWGQEMIVELGKIPAKFSQFKVDWPQFFTINATTTQIIIVGFAAGLMWLIGNSILLRTTTRSKFNGHHQ